MKISNRNLELYNNLLGLTQRNEAFYFVDQEVEKVKMRIFLYRLASYTDFCEPDALDSRGTMFELDVDNQPVRLACLPFHKFFNYNETPFTMNLDLSDVDYVVDKMDGSLISSYMVNDKLYLKTKGSLASEQAIMAMTLIQTEKFAPLFSFVNYITKMGYTVNMEITSPENRIVLSYPEPNLTVLSVRHNVTGVYLIRDWIKYFMEYPHGAQSFIVPDFTAQYENDMIGFINSVPSMTGIEGFVVKLTSGIMFKIKTDAYVSLHKTKDNINSPRNLYEAIVNGASDDLKSLFKTDEWCLNRINIMEAHVFKAHNHLVKTVEELHGANKHLDRKSFAIKMKAEVPNHVFGILMSKYIGRAVNFEEFMIKNYDLYKLPETIMSETPPPIDP